MASWKKALPNIGRRDCIRIMDDFINTVSEGWQYASCTWYQTPKHEIGLKKLGVVLDDVKAEYPLMTLELSCFGKEGLDSIGKLLKTVYKLGEK
jgi:hypothetical protein